MFSFVRVKSLKSMADIAEMAKHAARLGESVEARTRTDANPKRLAIAWRIGEPSKKNPRGSRTGFVQAPKDGDETIPDLVDLKAAYTWQTKRTGAKVRKGGKLVRVQHLLVGVSPDFLREAGDLHDSQNPKNIALMKEVLAWGRAAFGEDAPIAARLDLDEAGGAVVDLFLMPVRELTIGRPRLVDGEKVKPKGLYIAPSKAIDELAKKYDHKRRRNWSALQDSWNAHAKARLDARLERGERKEITGIEHLSPEAYGELKDLERAAAEAKASREAAQADREEAAVAGDAARSELAELRPVLQEARQARADLPQLRRERQAAEKDRDRARREAHEAEAALREQQAAEEVLAQVCREVAEAKAERDRLDHGLDLARAALAEATDRAHRAWAYVSELGSWLGDLLPRAAELVGRSPPPIPEDLFPEPEPSSPSPADPNSSPTSRRSDGPISC